MVPILKPTITLDPFLSHWAPLDVTKIMNLRASGAPLHASGALLQTDLVDVCLLSGACGAAGNGEIAKLCAFGVELQMDRFLIWGLRYRLTLVWITLSVIYYVFIRISDYCKFRTF